MSFGRSTSLTYILLLCITVGNMEQDEVNNNDDWLANLQQEEATTSPESTFISNLEKTLNKEESKPEATKNKESFLSKLLSTNPKAGDKTKSNQEPNSQATPNIGTWLIGLLSPQAKADTEVGDQTVGDKTESNQEPNSQATPNLLSWLLSLLSPKATGDTDKQNEGSDTKTKQPWFMSLLNLLKPKSTNATEPGISTDVKKPDINALSWISSILQQVLKPAEKNAKQPDSLVKSLLSLVTGQGTATDKSKSQSNEKHLQIHPVKIPNVYVSRFNEYFSHEWTEATFGILGPVGLSGRLGGLFMLLTSGGFGTNTISGAGSETNIIGQILNSLTSGAFGGKGIIGDNPQIDMLLSFANMLTGGKIPKRFADA